MAARDRPHLVVPQPPATEGFTRPSTGRGSEPPTFQGDRRAHGRRLKRELNEAFAETADRTEREGTYVTFESFPNLELALESLESRGSGERPELVNAHNDESQDRPKQLATVYIPAGQREYFLKRFNQYVDSADASKPSHAKLVEGIATIRRATILELWTDPANEFPPDDSTQHWWEVWLRNGDGRELIRMKEYAEAHGLQMGKHYLGFGDRTVALLRATVSQIADNFTALDDLAELRRPHTVANFLGDLFASEQMEWIDELLARLTPASGDVPTVCILDRGVQQEHPLLADSLSESDVHVADPQWLPHPVDSHGTEMAGLALYGDLQSAIESNEDVKLAHRLESVKILPDVGDNDPELYGAITARSVDQAEIQSPDRARVIMLAVTSRNSDGSGSTTVGQPTSWSAAVDALAFGRAIDDTDPNLSFLDREEPLRPRLFVISAGNIPQIAATDDHLDRCDLEPVEDPAHSWNAITVGAYSEHDDMSAAPDIFDGYVPIAPRGELSPHSRTSVTFDAKKWPFKPDVVASGGNVAASPDRTEAHTPENLALLTTRMRHLGQGFFTTTRATSAATAQVAAIAADIRAAYPSFRPETVRALVVHSAEWTDPMRHRFCADKSKVGRSKLLRRYGMGVPDLARAVRSASDALTLVSEARIHPYIREGNEQDAKVREMNLHELPWPHDELEALGEVNVRLRVTLSYFVEPNPSRRGWTGRYAYPSHGLRFAMKRADENVADFRGRINTKARGEDWTPVQRDPEQGWTLGPNQQQSAGSLHTDIWSGPAADLASKGAIAVYPVAGWWKNRKGYDQSDDGVNYSLVVSIESPEVEVDLYTPVSVRIAQMVEVET